MSRLAIYLLGPPRIELDGDPVHIGRAKAVALLAYLALEGGPHRRDTLATLLWPGYDQSSARAHLRRALVSLTKRLGHEWFVADRASIGLAPDAGPSNGSGRGFWLDVDRLRHGLAACEALDPASDEGLAPLTEATELYRDDFMAGFTLPDAPEFDAWQRFQARSLRDELGEALERLSAGHAAWAAYEPAIRCARRWLALDPTHEPAHRQLMALYTQAGRRGAALRQYRDCARVLEEELGLAPAAETTALYERVRAQRETAAPVAPSAGRAPREAPAFLSEPEATAPAQPLFVARERELARLDEHLEDALAGKGGVAFISGGPGRGKTALMRAFGQRALESHPGLLVASGACNAFSGVGDPYLPFREVMGMLSGDVEARWTAGTVSMEHARRLWDALPATVAALLDHGPHLIDALVPGAALLSRARTFETLRDSQSLSLYFAP
jgi:DNA-binding SARP family transcriptional activator